MCTQKKKRTTWEIVWYVCVHKGITPFMKKGKTSFLCVCILARYVLISNLSLRLSCHLVVEFCFLPENKEMVSPLHKTKKAAQGRCYSLDRVKNARVA